MLLTHDRVEEWREDFPDTPEDPRGVMDNDETEGFRVVGCKINQPVSPIWYSKANTFESLGQEKNETPVHVLQTKAGQVENQRALVEWRRQE